MRDTFYRCYLLFIKPEVFLRSSKQSNRLGNDREAIHSVYRFHSLHFEDMLQHNDNLC